MIITKTPYRISFFGGGSDYPSWYLKNEGMVLSTTIDKYVYISCRPLPAFFDHKYRIIWSKMEAVKKIEQIKHKVVRVMLKKYKVNEGVEIHYDGDLPARSGMGSSSAFVVGLLNLLSSFNGKKISKKDLAKKSIYFEQKTLNEIVGSQHQIAASYGGFNKILFKGNSFHVNKLSLSGERKKTLNDNLLLLYTGYRRTAEDMAKRYVNQLDKSKKSSISKIINLAKHGEKIIRNGDINDFGRLLHESWLEKKNLSTKVTNTKINEIYNEAIKKGALGGKLLGAGGGGFLLFYVPKVKQESFRRYFNKFVTVSFKFSKEGSKVLFKSFKK